MADALLGGLVINELLIDPNGANNFDTGRNGVARAGDEFIELLNTSTGPIDVSGVELWDASRDNWFTFPSGSVLQTGARATVVRNVQAGGNLPTGGPDDLVFDADVSGGVLNNKGDNAVVYDPAADAFIQTTYNGDSLDDPTSGPGYVGFSSTATRIGTGEDFGSDNDGFSIQRLVDGNDNFSNDQTPTPSAQYVCFTTGTLIETPGGPRPVEQLIEGNAVTAYEPDGSEADTARLLVRIFRRQIGPGELIQNPKLLPVKIEADALGNGLPRRDLVVSRQHKMLITSNIAERMFGAREVLVAAIRLTELPGFYVDEKVQSVEYFHLLFDKHEIILAEGAPTESFFIGPETLRVLPREAREEVLTLFPEITLESETPVPARPILAGRLQKRLIDRHRKNIEELLC
ncbi:Hint domain-containing protein [Ruegeria hyattellae]|uniref:Hint domain-containing protein n=1 Tax=Ruegeria hyattellae TaxID=3233337 RepID=UPI00355BAAA0